MKRIYQITLFVILFDLGYACGDAPTARDVVTNSNLEDIRSRKKELSKQQKALNEEMTLLDSLINAKEENRNIPLVTMLNVVPKQFDHFIELRGDVTTKKNVLIYPEVAGILTKIYVTEGQKVSKGQLLGSIDDGGMKSQLLQLETQLALSKETFERQERLWERKIGSEIQYLQMKSNYETQKSAVKQLKSQLDKFKIRAPFSGIIDNVIKDQGIVVAPVGAGSEIFRIINLSEMYVKVPVPESYIATIATGEDVEVYFSVLNKTISSKVRQTGNYINPNNRSFIVEVSVPNPNRQIKPNMTAKVLINDYSNSQALLIPQSIISENAEGEQYVFVASTMDVDGQALVKKKIITTGKTKGDDIEILTGISNGDSVIMEGARSVKDGQQVKILKM